MHKHHKRKRHQAPISVINITRISDVVTITFTTSLNTKEDDIQLYRVQSLGRQQRCFFDDDDDNDDRSHQRTHSGVNVTNDDK